MSSSRPIDPFDPKGPAAATRWTRWKRTFLTAIAYENTPTPRKLIALRHLGGADLQDVIEGLVEPGNTLEEVLNALDAHFKPKINRPFEINAFMNTCQEVDETIESFTIRLRQLARSCDFANMSDDVMIVAAFMANCQDIELRKKLLTDEELSFEKAFTIARNHESAKEKVKTFRKKEEEAVEANRVARDEERSQRFRRTSGTNKRQEACRRCGATHHTSKECTFAIGKKCYNCGKMDHLARVCLSRRNKRDSDSRDSGSGSNNKANQVSNESDGEENNVFTINTTETTQQHEGTRKQAHTTVKMNNVPIEVLIDTGADQSTMTVNDFRSIQRRCRVKLEKADRKLRTYSGEEVHVLGKAKLTVSKHGEEIETFVYVVDGPKKNLLGRFDSISLKLVEFRLNNLEHENDEINVKEKFPKCFEGLGKLKNHRQHIHVDQKVPPVAQKPRRLPFKVREKVEAEVQRLINADVIEKVDGPTRWLSPVCVVTKPNGKVRLCIDMRRANEAVLRTNYHLPTLEEVISEMDGAKFISKLDLREGFHQIELDDESRAITAFTTETGIYRYKRLFFGISSAPEIFQNLIQQAVTGLSGVRNIQDDIIVYGRTENEHDQRLLELLKRLEDCNLTLNYEKCRFRTAEIVFMGHRLTTEGVLPDERKVAAIKNMNRPTTPTEVRSFLGLVGYCSKFISNYAHKTEALCNLTRNETKWRWEAEEEQAFKRLKNDLSATTTLAYYHRDYPITLTVDASPIGLGAVLSQEEPYKGKRVVSMASRLLSEVERPYSQTEKEALAIVWACEHYKLYLLGTNFTIETDHRPLEALYATNSKPSARIERWVLRLQPFKYKIKYIKGKDNVADSLSRLSANKPEKLDEEDYDLNTLVTYAIPAAISIKQLRDNIDDEYEQLRQAVRHGKKKEAPTAYQSQWNELTIIDDMIMRHDTLVIPTPLREKTLELAHTGHQGIVRTKEKIRSKVWWPGVNEDVEKMVKRCIPCQATKADMKKSATHPTPLPDGPWQHLAIDICGPFPDGSNVLILGDYYSRWPEGEIIKSTNTSAIINWLERVFGRFGLPRKITTDNGTQFTSNEFATYLQARGIEHIRTAPYWPQANGMVERMNRSFQSAVEAAKIEGQTWKAALEPFLFAYRTTPHPATNKSPAELLLKWKVHDGLPSIPDAASDEQVRSRDREYKRKYSKQPVVEHGRPSVGDKVLVKRMGVLKKLQAKYDPTPCTVVKVKNDTIIVRHPNGHNIRRHVTHTRRLLP